MKGAAATAATAWAVLLVAGCAAAWGVWWAVDAASREVGLPPRGVVVVTAVVIAFLPVQGGRPRRRRTVLLAVLAGAAAGAVTARVSRPAAPHRGAPPSPQTVAQSAPTTPSRSLP